MLNNKMKKIEENLWLSSGSHFLKFIQGDFLLCVFFKLNPT